MLPEFCLLCEGWVQRSASVPLCSRHSEPLSRIPEPRCYQCQRPMKPSPGTREPTAFSLVCGDCRTRELILTRVRCGFLLTEAARTIVLDWKFQRRRRWSSWLGDRLRRLIGPTLEDYGISGLIPVPLHPDRRRERGFNQALDLARRLETEAWPVLEGLRKVRSTEPQSTLSREERTLNLKGAFDVPDELDLDSGASVAVVDDVYTTGSTLRECARTLQAERNCSVLGITLLRAIPHDDRSGSRPDST